MLTLTSHGPWVSKESGLRGQVLSPQGCGVVLKPTRAAFESMGAGHSAPGTWRRHSSSWERAFLMTRPHEALGQKKGLNKEEFAANTLAKKKRTQDQTSPYWPGS